MTTTQQHGAFTPDERKQLAKQCDLDLITEVGLYLGNKLVWDMGCGDGAYIRALRDQTHSTQIAGVEGSHVAMDIPGVVQWDLCVPLWLGTRGNVLCLEVGEHIPQAHEEVFLDNLSRHCLDRMVLSWAIPGQHGTRHVNCRENTYIIERMAERGLYWQEQPTLNLRAAASLHWFKKSVMAFERNPF